MDIKTDDKLKKKLKDDFKKMELESGGPMWVKVTLTEDGLIIDSKGIPTDAMPMLFLSIAHAASTGNIKPLVSPQTIN